MPYKKLSELPAGVRSQLPGQAQEIYKATFNNAWDEYKDAKNRRREESREETSHKVAWSAVKNKYKKTGDDEWKRK